jgi:hypothetical protein
MIGKVILKVDRRPHCTNGWGPTKKFPGCNYTGGHFCDKLAKHKGRCRCACGSVSKTKPREE